MEKVKANLQQQLSELETLQSMYNKEELKVEDLNVLAHINAFVEGRIEDLPPYLDLAVYILIDKEKFELCINLPHDYPDSGKPDLFVRNHKLRRNEHASINKDLKEHVDSLDCGEACIFSAICWLQDNGEKYLVPDEQVSEKIEEKDESLVRFWIYSHHIYSKTKRREIEDLALKLNISGFCMPGKPGIICVEGAKSDCEEWWQTIKAMNWKRIFCKLIEDCEDRKFRTFSEVVFQNSSIKCNHMDMGELYKFLQEHECGYIFKDIFGVEAR